MDAFVQGIADSISNALGATLAVFLLSMIPIAEARFAIPFGMSMGLSYGQAFGWAFLGSSLMAPILLLVFIPIINALSKTKLFSKIGKFLYDKFEKKSRSLASKASAADGGKKAFITKSDAKKMGGTALFVAVPLPLTGVWTGSAVASIIKIGFVKGLIGVIAGNAVACAIITLISFLFAPYVNYITLAFFLIAIAVVIFLIVKLIVFKPEDSGAQSVDGKANNDEANNCENGSDQNKENINSDSDTVSMPEPKHEE